MNTRIILLFIGMTILSACSTASSLLSFGDGDESVTTVAAAPVAAVPAFTGTQDDWCQKVAASERLRAQGAGYDAATLDRMTLASFQQCSLLQPR